MFDRNGRKMLSISTKSFFQLLIFVSLLVGVAQSIASSNDNKLDTYSLVDELEYNESHRQGRCKIFLLCFVFSFKLKVALNSFI